MLKLKNNKFKSQWICFAIFCFIAFVSLMYEDIHTSSVNANSLFNSIISGNFPNGYYFESAFYIPVHIAFAIWNLPVELLRLFGILTTESTIFLLWAKLLLVVCLCVIIKYTKKILEEAEMGEKGDFWALFLASSFLIFCPIFDMSQYDCIGIAIGLYALYLILKDNGNLSVKALLLLSLAASFKMFYLFAAIAIVLVLERSFVKILEKLGIVLSVSIIFVILSKVLNSIRAASNNIALSASLTDSSASVPKDLGITLAGRLFNSTIDGGIYKISLVFVFLFGLYFMILLTKRPESKKDIIYEVVYTIAATYFILVTFTIAHPQWSIFPGVFMILMIALSRKESIKRNIILEFIFEISLLIQQFSYYDFVYASEGEFNFLIFKNIKTHLFGPDLTSPGNITGIMDGKPMMIVAALSFVSGLALFVINNPWRKDNENKADEKEIIKAATVRVTFIGLYLLVAFAIRFIF